MNDAFFHAQAAALAARAQAAGKTESERLKFVFRLLYSRDPAADELRDLHQFLAQSRSEEGWPALVRVLLASNEFLTLD